MRYRLLGRSGLRVSEVGLGTMTFGGDGAWAAERDEARRIFARYLEAGGNLIDTADRYGNGASERLVRELVAADRERVVLGTKYTFTRRSGDPNASGNHRKNLVGALDASLRRLATDYVDVYWVHAWDFLTPIDEVLRALDDQVRAGKILYAGVSNVPAWVVARADAIADLRGWTGFCGVQVEYSLARRDAERELLPMAKALDIALVAWSPLGGGLLTGKYGRASGSNGSQPRRLAPDDPSLGVRALRAAALVAEVAREAGVSPAAAAIEWLLRRKCPPIPLLGARTEAQLEETLRGLEGNLDERQLERLDAATAIEAGAPHDFLAAPQLRDRIYGGFFDDLARCAGRSL
jgi:aryl-alcohol dehydrogenase-like predicted oxidoreductase